MAFRQKVAGEEKQPKGKFQGGLTFMALFIVMACVIYLPWEKFLPIKAEPVAYPVYAPDPSAAPAAAPAGSGSVAGDLALRRYGTAPVDQGPVTAWYNDSQMFMKKLVEIRRTLAGTKITLVVLIGLVLPFSLFFFLK